MALFRLTCLPSLALVYLALFSFADSRGNRRLFKRHPVGNPAPVSQSWFTVPLSNGYAALPGPSNDVNLIAIGIGRGVQYYACDSEFAVPSNVGGSGDIYDANAIIPYLSSEDDLHNLVKYFYNYNYASLENSSLQLIGVHYNNPEPIFDLGQIGWFSGSIEMVIDSPLANADLQAVDWAQMSCATPNSTMQSVYRVETYGGGGPCNCQGQPKISTWQYACEYWFYA